MSSYLSSEQNSHSNGVSVESTKTVATPRMNGHINGGGVKSSFTIQETPVENFRRLKVIVIGAGFCGIYCGIRIPEKLRNVDLVIYEKNGGVSGTWYENRYPGCACDIPAHSYQYSFNPNPRWSEVYASAPEIREYMEATVRKYSVDRFIKLSHKVDSCRWDEKSGKWFLQVTDLVNNYQFEDSAEVLINARGALNELSWPDIQGLRDFQGELMHSAAWNQNYDFKNKKIGLIGTGSSAIQIAPKLQEIPGAHLSIFSRNKIWISPLWCQEIWDSIGMKGYKFSEEQKDNFSNDPSALLKFRLAIETMGHDFHGTTLQATPKQKEAQEFFTSVMKSRLKSRPDIFEKMLPDFSPGCRRLTPGPGYLEALTQPNVDYITTPISKIEKTGIRGDDGFHEFDVIVCATGFKAFKAPPFPIVGRDGITLADHWAEHPRTYLSFAADKFPNHFLTQGPNGAIGAGSLTIMLEATGDYIIKCIRKLQKENYKSMVPKPARVDDFIEYTRAYFPRTIYKDNCRSWYKNKNDDITGPWPGSTLHYLESIRSPRWEDWEYESLTDDNENSEHVNRFRWLGNGWTKNQMESRHMAWYLHPQFLDVETPVAPLPEESERFAMRPFSY